MTTIKLRCPDCREAFRWPAGADWPKHCPECGFDVSLPERDEVAMPFVRKGATQAAVDNVYKAMEEGAAHRAQVAAEMLGVPAADVADLKLTDMRDNLRQGDIAAPTVTNAVSQNMERMQAVGAAVGFTPAGAAHSSAVQTGAFPNAGARMQQLVRSRHSSYCDERQAGRVSSDAPAVETQMPAYRRRV
jgi:hypothetical protein